MNDEPNTPPETPEPSEPEPENSGSAGENSRFVVPDPADPPDGTPTTFVPPATPFAPPSAPAPQWQPPPAGPSGQPYQQQPYQQQPTQGQPVAGPPSGPPTAVGPAVPVGGWTQQQPQPYQQQTYQQQPYQQQPYGQQPYQPGWGTQGPPPPETTGGGNGVKVLIGVVIALLVAVGAFLGVRALLDSSSIDGTVDECRIDPDGTLTASGTVHSGNEIDQTLSIRFDDADTGSEVDRTTVDVSGAADEDVPWTVRGQAGDSVNKVTCVLGPLD